jgi:catechol 2,3-dioxygenase-like lactoylglutathione lyase family enzyme
VDTFRVLQIDHVELFVADRYEAAEWYRRILGLHIIPKFEPTPW